MTMRIFDFTSGQTIIFDDYGNTIILGNNNRESVAVDNGFLNTIILGNGDNDSIIAYDSTDIIIPGDNGDYGSLSGGSTITVGNGNHDKIILGDYLGASLFDTVTVGNGNRDTIDASKSFEDHITVGNGNHDKIILGYNTALTVGNGNDSITLGCNSDITVGTGHDHFVFEEGKTSGAAAIIGFDPHKDSFTFPSVIKPSQVSYHDNAYGDAVITVAHPATPDGFGAMMNEAAIILQGVHTQDLLPHDFHFSDPATPDGFGAMMNPLAHLTTMQHPTDHGLL